ncbi:hypothetical protein JAAARDRAFT_540486 [Jaapia argillacea MUCL 33604]|uniref:ZIP zinc/iron transport family n=1 Tax=Jaapia argillacea MUCL 33604 TaxID=933084 RepID=A0A067PKP7_9AGAM|nr:hypothetical protein JAAARDRAFT_540486 [Jaapia argillacea MUCL 33604]
MSASSTIAALPSPSSYDPSDTPFGVPNCGSGGGAENYRSLRIASIFIILAASSTGALFPVLAKRSTWLNVPAGVFNFAKYFGSGVIIATAFIHLLSPALDELGSDCLSPAWREYPYALAICLASIFAIFCTELFAFRLGTARLAKLGLHHDPHGHSVTRGAGSHAAHGPEGLEKTLSSSDLPESHSSPHHNHHHHQHDVETGALEKRASSSSDHYREPKPDHQHRDILGPELAPGALTPATPKDVEMGESPAGLHLHNHGTIGSAATVYDHHHDPAVAQIVGIAILEFGIVLHSVLIGMTLAVDEDFKILFIVIVFHQLFEGLGLGSRLAFLQLPPAYRHVPVYAAMLFGITTPTGIAIGLGIRTSYNPGSMEASIVSGVMDAVSSGILIYTGLVELLAHEFLFSQEMINASNGKLLYALGCMFAGCALMALLGKWA